MTRVNNVTRNAHAKRFIQEIFADRLLAEGFACPDDKLLCWYRVKNKEIVNSICFYTPWSAMPLMVSIGYGIHPLFTLPARVPSVYAPDRPVDRDTFREQCLIPNPDIGYCNMKMYHPDAQVYAPEGGFGIHTLDGVLLPMMDKVQSMEDCYRLHKERYLSNTTVPAEFRFNSASITFMDEAVFFHDTNVFPFLAARLEQLIRFYEMETAEKPASKALRAALQHVHSLNQALYEGKGEEHMAYLQQQKADNIVQLNKKFGITL